MAGSNRAGARDALHNSQPIRSAAESAFGLSHLFQEEPSIVRCLLFDKRPASNWKIGWHQDLNIRQTDGETLEWDKLARVLTLRLHLDTTTAENGALKVLPGSHLQGPLSDQQRRDLDIEPVTVEAEAGQVLIMSPLLVHSSSPSANPSHRRVIHVEYLQG